MLPFDDYGSGFGGGRQEETLDNTEAVGRVRQGARTGPPESKRSVDSDDSMANIRPARHRRGAKE